MVRRLTSPVGPPLGGQSALTRARWFAIGITLTLAIAGSTVAHAVVTGDATAGTQVDHTPNVYDIKRGTSVGSNLFHSFGEFSVEAGATAKFHAPGNINNILSRVTGGLRSEIHGTIDAPTNLYLINPNGVIFGPDASLQVNGAFYASTANEIRFRDTDKTFSATTPQSMFTSAPPAAFGFLPTALGFLNGNASGRIEANLSIPRESPMTGLSLVASNVALNGSVNKAGLPLSLIGASGATRVPITATQAETPASSPTGSVSLTSRSVQAGKVRIAGGRISIDGAIIRSTTKAADGDGVSIVGNEVTLKSPRFLSQSGAVSVTAHERLDAQGTLILTSGGTGHILIKGGEIVLDGTALTANGSPFSRGGNISVDAGAGITLSNFTKFTTAGSNVAAGDINITGQSLQITNNSGLDSNGFSRANGGAINVRVKDNIAMSGESFISGSAAGFGTSAGDIVLNSERLTMAGGSRIESEAFVGSNGGDISITAQRAVALAGVSNTGPTKISTVSRARGSAGNIRIDTQQLSVRDGATITASTESTGAGGNVVANASGRITIDGGENNAAGISTRSTSAAPGAGDAGTIHVTSQNLAIKDGGFISTESTAASGGNIDIDVTFALTLNKGRITTSVKTGAGNGGNIDIDPVFVILFDSLIQANAFDGKGGNIKIITQNFFIDNLSQLSATSETSIDGTIEIRSPDSDVSESLAVLPAEFADATSQLAERCAARRGKLKGSFVGTGRGGLPRGPENALASRYTSDVLTLATNQSNAEGAPTLASLAEQHGFVPSTLVLSCYA